MPEAMGRLLREAPDVTLQVLPASEEIPMTQQSMLIMIMIIVIVI